MDAFRSDRVDIDEREAQEISSLLLEIGSVTTDGESPQKLLCLSVKNWDYDQDLLLI